MAPDKIERFLAAHWPAVSRLLTEHGPWEGVKGARAEVIQFQTTAHTLSLILGLLGTASSLRVLAGAGALFGLATLAHGSGFLAVFVAGILLGDEPAPYKTDVERFHATLASLGEITAFVVLGLTVSLSSLGDGHAWQIGLGLAVLLAFVVRPVLVGLAIAPISLRRPERIFLLWAGLKGAVPILLATFVLHDQQTHGQAANGVRLYDIVVVVVTFSVVVQGGLVPTVARWVGLDLQAVEPEPFGPAPSADLH